MSVQGSNVQLSKDLIQAIQNHIPKHILGDYLKFNKKPVARSWDELFTKNSSEQALFLNLLTEMLCFSRKTIFAYNADGLDLSPLDTANTSSLDVIQEMKNAQNNHRLFRKDQDQRYSSYTFSCKKAAFETYILSQSDLAPAKQSLWTPTSEIKLRTPVMVTVLDSLIYDSHDKILFVAIDNSRYGFEESEFDRQAELLTSIRAICPTLSTIDIIDMYPSIDGIYQKKSEGIIHRLAFECNTGAVRDERLKQGQLDLRDERYHTHGKAAIGGKISPFRAGVTWHPTKYKNLISEIDVEIKGNRKNLHQQGGVYSFDVRSVGTFNELSFALNRMILYADF